MKEREKKETWASGEQRDYAFQKCLKVRGVKQDQPSLQAGYMHPLIHPCTQMVNTSIGATYNGNLESMEIKLEYTCPSKRYKASKQRE